MVMQALTFRNTKPPPPPAPIIPTVKYRCPNNVSEPSGQHSFEPALVGHGWLQDAGVHVNRYRKSADEASAPEYTMGIGNFDLISQNATIHAFSPSRTQHVSHLPQTSL